MQIDWTEMWIKKSGFTLIEVIIAITVFSVGVLTVLNLIMYNLSTIDKVQTKITATILAKEWLELAYNIRDTNIQKWFARDCLLKPASEINVNEDAETETEDVCAMHFASGDENTVYQFGFSTGQYYFYDSSIWSGFDELFEANRVYYYTGEIRGHTMFWYGYAQNGWTWMEIPYARYIRFKAVKDGENILPTDKILKVESHALYRKWWYQWEIVLESFMGNF